MNNEAFTDHYSFINTEASTDHSKRGKNSSINRPRPLASKRVDLIPNKLI